MWSCALCKIPTYCEWQLLQSTASTAASEPNGADGAQRKRRKWDISISTSASEVLTTANWYGNAHVAFMFAFKFSCVLFFLNQKKKKKKHELKRVALMRGADFHVHSVAVSFGSTWCVHCGRAQAKKVLLRWKKGGGGFIFTETIPQLPVSVITQLLPVTNEAHQLRNYLALSTMLLFFQLENNSSVRFIISQEVNWKR